MNFFSKDNNQAYLYVAPAVILVGLVCIYPILRTLVMSFTDNDGLNPAKFIGYVCKCGEKCDKSLICKLCK